MIYIIYRSTEYFYYKGQYYGGGSVVQFSEDYINDQAALGKKVWKYAFFSHKKLNNGTGVLMHFAWKPPTYCEMLDDGMTYEEKNVYEISVDINSLELEYAIESIIKPIYPPENVSFRVPGYHEDMTPIKDTEVPELMVAWVIFIAFLIFSLVFKEWYIIWPIAGFVFDKIRNDMLSR